MTKNENAVDLPPLTIAVDALMLRHGRLAVLAAAFGGLLRVGLLHRDLDAMPDHLRHDIGLPPKADPPRLGERMW